MAMMASFIGNIGTGLFFTVAFLFVLTTVVFFHELGHFLVARWNGVAVSTFSIGFGKELFGFNDRHGTRWRFAMIPLGGYVKFIDDENAASMPKKDMVDLSGKELEGTFQSKTLAQKSAVVAAGPIANFILSIVIFAGIFLVNGERLLKPVIVGVMENSPAKKAGFRHGDEITDIDGDKMYSVQDLQRVISVNANNPLNIGILRDGQAQKIKVIPAVKHISDGFDGGQNIGQIGIDFSPVTPVGKIKEGSAAQKAGMKIGDLITHINGQEMIRYGSLLDILEKNAGKPLAFDIKRDGKPLKLSVTPIAVKAKDAAGNEVTRGLLGVAFSNKGLAYTTRHYNPVTALWKGTTETYFVLKRTVFFIKQIITGEQSYKNLGGPGKIAYVSGKVAQDYGLMSLISLIALLSVSIGFMNLLPIPVLDGGHLLFYAIEAIKGSPLSESTQEFGFKIGMSLMLMMMVFVFWNDTNFFINLFGK